ncbi:MAG: hypothetical protein LKK54_06165 [Ancrocorticia sp.]|jgi:Protein-tyrosine-phosphatase|nr:hypothetical protein [Ancrocorticia sp.]MCI1933215.1 hypothetical protein [Ancrocorticia sp.]MCI2179198.1 hypothetical protein [Ancrocorticia sp.]MCI2193733.1 hypothetical protein [Ancrocorticia sp.]MCI2199299.1 hypothetical protein [Ancrocorticia sp.]
MAPFRILTVCTGNICRSPLAEFLLRDTLDPQLFTVESAGTRAVPGSRVPPQQVEVALGLGITDIGRHEARRLTPDMIAQADLVLTASLSRRRRVVRTLPQATKKTFTMREFAHIAHEITVGDINTLAARGLSTLEAGVAAAYQLRGTVRMLTEEELDIVDPYGKPDAVYQESAHQLAPAIRDTAAFFNSLTPADAHPQKEVFTMQRPAQHQPLESVQADQGPHISRTLAGTTVSSGSTTWQQREYTPAYIADTETRSSSPFSHRAPARGKHWRVR